VIQREGDNQQRPRAAGVRREEKSRKRGQGDHKERAPAPKKKRKKRHSGGAVMKITINAAAALTEIRAMYIHGRSSPRSGQPN
jgi:hypothetical protein